MAVVFFEEKPNYAKGAFEPVIDYLAGLNISAFYRALQPRDATTAPHEDSGSDEIVHGGLDSDTVSEIEPADLTDTMGMIREMEQHDHLHYVF
ncbi:hypothetical protein F443_04430 [Phytophthora nicotianae P1569]|uniref:Uncharacterized protein n=1 Tax=Phytophthora nicotianae P1569 TaxID=1317065 RepID=V9FNQ6_PHYNI|nr:hypothetical protein F443_04430 [Phytophthora nicotianae P1569]